MDINLIDEIIKELKDLKSNIKKREVKIQKSSGDIKQKALQGYCFDIANLGMYIEMNLYKIHCGCYKIGASPLYPENWYGEKQFNIDGWHSYKQNFVKPSL